MSDKEFLERWSRRKRAAEAISQSPLPAPVSDATEKEGAKSSAAETKAVEEFDLSTLPSLDSITATTDVTVFLRKGVPLALSREALRRAWLADPTIREFVGLAENAWDFNDPNAMPGFGPLDYTTEQLRDLIARIVNERWRADEEGTPNSAAPQLSQDFVMSEDAGSEPDRKAVTDRAESGNDQAESREERAELRHPEPPNVPVVTRESQTDGLSIVHRTHGSALPR